MKALSFRVVVALSLALSLLSSCYRAPELDGANQVHDPNVLATMQKDAGLAAQSWSIVDSFMWSVVGEATGPGCALGIARGGELVYLQGYGRAVVGGEVCNGGECVPLGGEPWSVGTVAAVGSTSKTFTAAAAFLMHERGLLDVNRAVGAYLPTSNARLAATPIYELLRHSSGVGGATKDQAFSPTWTQTVAGCAGQDDLFCQAVDHMLARPAAAFLHYEADELVADLAQNDPGDGVPSEGVYSNVGYSVLGALIDEVARDTTSGGYEAWIWENVGQYTGNVLSRHNLLSLALSHSWRADDIPHRAVGYAPDGDGFQAFEAWQGTGGLEGWQGPSGGWAMTIGDLTRFAVALNTEQIVGNGALAAMRLRWSEIDELGIDYGMGVILGTGDQPPYWHGGVIAGHTSVWAWWDEFAWSGQSLAVAIICNRSDIDAFALRGHALSIAASTLGTAPRPRQPRARPAIGSRSVDRATFALDGSTAWQAEPKDAFAPLSGLSRTLLLAVKDTPRGLSLHLSEGTVRRGEVVRATKPRPLGVAEFGADPRFRTRPTNVKLKTTLGKVRVARLVVEGSFDQSGAALGDVALSGVLDVRQARKLLGWKRASACELVARAGAACGPCADGVPACVTVRYQGLSGERVRGRPR